MSCGIILAAGESTRLPSKVLLPISEQLIAIESAIVMSQYCCAQTVVVCGCSLVMDALKMRGWQNNISYVFQPKPLGVCDAVARGACASLHDKCCVFFGDNIYPTADVNHIKKCLGMSKKFASVREVDLPGLDGFTTSEGWVSRKENPKLKLAGWVSLQRSIAMGGIPDLELYEWLNELDVLAYKVDGSNWWDIGTPTNYSAFIESGGLK